MFWKIIISLQFLSAVLLLSGCDMGSPVPDAVDTGETPSVINVKSGASNGTLTFSSNRFWELDVPKDVDWLEFSQVTGVAGSASVKYLVETNYDRGERSAAITIRAGSASESIVFIQAGDVEVPVSLSDNQVVISSEGGSFSIGVTSSVGYEILSLPQWVRISASESTHDRVVFIVDRNVFADERSLTVIFLDERGNKAELQLLQDGSPSAFTVSQEEFELSCQGGTFSLEVCSKLNYHIVSMSEWISELPSDSACVHSFLIGENESVFPRTGEIVFENSASTRIAVTVNQSGAEVIFAIPSRSVDVPREGGRIKVDVVANVDYHIASIPQWIEAVDYNDGSGGLCFRVQGNESASRRVGEIVFEDCFGDRIMVEVTQAGESNVFKADNYRFTLDGEETVMKITITSDLDYSITGMPQWIAEVVTKGTLVREHTFKVSANTSGAPRYGEVVFRNSADRTLYVNILQKSAN